MTGQFLCGTCKIEVKNEDESVQCDLCDKLNYVFCIVISSVKCEKLNHSNIVCYRGIFQCVQSKCFFLVYRIKNSIHSYPETLLLIVLKSYLQQKLIDIKRDPK